MFDLVDRVRQASVGEAFRRHVVTVVAVLVAGVVLARNVDPAAIALQLRALDIGLYLLAVATYYLTVPLRAYRWRLLLEGIGSQVPFRELSILTILSLFFNTILPAKSGDLYKTHHVCTDRESTRTAVLGTVTIERTVDIAVLGLGLVVTLAVVTRRLTDDLRTLALAALLVVGGLLAAVIAVVLFPDSRVPERFRGYFREFTSGINSVSSGRQLGAVLVLTGSIWCTNVVRMTLTFAALGLPVNLLEVLFVSFLLAFLTGLPYTPAGVGFVEVIGTAAVVGLGFPKSASVSLVFLDRLITVVSVVVVGVAVYVVVKYVDWYRD